MASTIDIFNSAKIDAVKLTGSSGFYNNIGEITESAKLQNKFISNVDYSNPANFARFGSAEEYYKNAINYIATEYPYDGALAAKDKWINSLNELEYYIFKEEYPRHKGYVELTSSQYISAFSPSRDMVENEAKNVYVNGNKYFVSESLNYTDGFTFETWLKITQTPDAASILSLNAAVYSGGSFTTYQVFAVATYLNNFYLLGSSSAAVFPNTVIQNDEWHHYAFSVNSNSSSLYIDGVLTEQISTPSFVDTSEAYAFYKIGLIPEAQKSLYSSSGSYTVSPTFVIGGTSFYGGNGAITSFDETRFWNKERSLEQIGRYWFTNVDGNDFDDINNTNLILYYKYNEGWNTNQDICLDYSGFRNNGVIANYNTYTCRYTGSAVDQSGLVDDVEQESIIYAPSINYSTDILEPYYSEMVLSGSDYDETNLNALYKKFPSWVLETEEENTTKHLKQIVQIVSSYFDDLYNKIGEISKYKHLQQTADKNKLYPFYDKILTSTGFDVTELFNNLDVIEKISSRSDTNIFDEDIQKIKNSIFQNIYNNLSYILKAKGTEKSIRSFLRSYGISENIARINLYANNAEYFIADKYSETTTKRKTLTLTGSQTVYLEGQGVLVEQTGSTYTLESSVIFPKSLANTAPETASLMYFYTSGPSSYQTSSTKLRAFLMVENEEYGSRFCLYTGSAGSSSVGIAASSSYVSNLYDDTVWNISIGFRPDIDTLKGITTYPAQLLDFRVVNTRKENAPFFSGSAYIYALNFYNDYSHYGIGAYNLSDIGNTGMTGQTVYYSHAKYLYCNYWSTYLSDNELIVHNKDINNYGVE
jgi:hypothetical protein